MITVISGTNRPGSNTLKVARLAAAALSKKGEKSALLDLAELPQAIFDPASYSEKPDSFAPFSKAVLDSAGLLVVTPEYNGGPPGVLKYFIDMLKFPESFERKPVGFLGLSAGMSGALRPVEQLQQIFGYRNAFLFPERLFLPGIGSLLDADGPLKDPELQARLERQVLRFAVFARHMLSLV
ncbi:MAG: NAD(P)H-dependent oxidoreductase [Verrucomicrobia bacterium]|nr:NAD(P)H-dependent oxidoreductase [Verrucomicrobiota bacterium]